MAARANWPWKQNKTKKITVNFTDVELRFDVVVEPDPQHILNANVNP